MADDLAGGELCLEVTWRKQPLIEELCSFLLYSRFFFVAVLWVVAKFPGCKLGSVRLLLRIRGRSRDFAIGLDVFAPRLLEEL